jgi:hypothetical protein
MLRKNIYAIAMGLVGAVLPLASIRAQETKSSGETETPIRVQVPVTAPEGKISYDEEVLVVTDDTPPQGEYWIGIALGELPEIVKQQLELDHGLVVEDVFPDSPAAKAEFKKFDVLLKAADKPLAQPADILKAVDEAKDQELTVEVIRSGDRLKLRVVPVKRPKAADGEAAPTDAPAPSDLRRLSLKKLEEALVELKAADGKQSLELFFARPGVVTGGLKVARLPENMSVSITKEGDAPAKVRIKRGDQEWNTTADKLFDLPPDLRVHIEQLLGGLMHPMTEQRTLVVRAPQATTMARPPGSSFTPVNPGVTGPIAVLPRSTGGNPAGIHAYRVVDRVEAGDVARKLDLILTKLDALESKSLEQLQDEVRRMRKELDDLRNK